MYIDTHAHLYLDRFDIDRDEVIRRARSSKIEKIINVGIDLATGQESIELAEKYDFIYATAGIHPNETAKASENYLPVVENMLKHPKVVALGEIGLDYYWDFSPKDVQKKILMQQVQLAESMNVPVIIHTRKAWHDILPFFEKEFKRKIKGVFHCYSGDIQQAERILELGFHISFTGVVTYKNSNAIEIAKHIPNNRLLLETDCPFMPPVPHRGKRSEPAYIPLIAEKIAYAKRISLEDLAKITTENAEKLFRFNDKT